MLDIKNIDWKYISKHNNQVFIISEKILLNMDLFSEETQNTFRNNTEIEKFVEHKEKFYSIYTINQRIVDSKNNIILVCDEKTEDYTN
ncbi:hypothetical protein EDC18_102408 [Natranaerovirga pectinivora]|uniref:Uncharacterized protein n=1 Tax=Natranaerovirga pectinivora TaxID=682400 RepID=A0A4R3MN20_9FIRM|nr:hypothetical protein [Natranaerovirga pectinivora]TCT16389.1 hypothetical protein EDC18_102408 [Natranaerovirga pectinivora]